jgi:hypothetical protein
VRDFFEERGWNVVCLVFDGLMVLRREGRGISHGLLNELAEHCETHIPGIRSVWKEKSMENAESTAFVDFAFQPAPALQTGFHHVVEYSHKDQLVAYEHKAAGETRYGLQPVVFEHHKVQLVAATTGLGKSHVARLAIGSHKRVLIVTARIQQAKTIAGDLRRHGIHDFVCYNKTQGYEEIRGSLYPHQRVVVQYESLHRLQKADGRMLNGKFDLVVLDEIRSILAQRVSITTNGGRLRDNNAIFKLILKGSVQILAMDADLLMDGMVRDFLLDPDLFRQSQIQLHLYTFVPARLQRGVRVTLSEAQFVVDLKKDVLQNHRVLAPFRSKRHM